jgi:hypothetical protein
LRHKSFRDPGSLRAFYDFLRFRALTTRGTTPRATHTITIICAFSYLTECAHRINFLVGSHGYRSDGSIFYRYPDGSEYYRPSHGNIRFRPPEDPPEKVEGAGATATPASPVKDRAWRPWYDWPPQLNIFVKTNGPSVTIGDNSGSTITFEPVGSNADLEITPARDQSVSPHFRHGR